MTSPAPASTDGSNRIAELTLDPASLAALSPEAELERRVAVKDLIEANTFALTSGPAGPYTVRLHTQDNKLVFTVQGEGGQDAERVLALSLTPFRRITRDYLMMCDSYYTAMREATPQQIETVDMARRGVHNEGAELLQERLAGKAETDHDTARRLFTLLSALFRPR